MYIALLITGIIITSIAILAITVFTISNFIVKRINKEERKDMSDDEKRKEKLFSKSLKWLKRILKLINKRLLENLWAFYGIASISIVGGISMAVIGAVLENNYQREMASSSSDSSQSSSIFISSSSSITISSTSISITSSSAEESSLPSNSSQISETSSIESSSSDVSSSQSSSLIEVSSSSSSSSSSVDSSNSEPYVLSYTVRYVMLCDYDETYSERSYPFELIVKESGFAENYEEHTSSVISLQVIKWYKDSGCTEEFEFDTPINENITLYGYYYDEP